MDSTIPQLATTFPKPLFDRPFVLSMGPQRSGTSWLDRYLRNRGDVCLPSGVKEVSFFDCHYERGPKFYRDHFRLQPAHKIAAEISTTAFDAPGAAKRVYKIFNSNIRLLCPLRHPVARSYSLYQHYKRYGFVSGTLQQACEQNPQILTSSCYAQHLQEWLSVFNKDDIHFTFQEYMEANLRGYVVEVCNALQIPFVMPSTEISRRYNSSAEAPIPVIARTAHSSAVWLRRHRLYPVINAAKKMGLRKLMLGVEKNESGCSIPVDDRKWLEDRLFGQIECLEKITGPLPQWRVAPLQNG
jgi:hypothetical protein